jgi:hypothetical protein
VNKPPGLRFHPVHRFEGNSLLSRAIGHVRRRGYQNDDQNDNQNNQNDRDEVPTPHVIHRLDMDTSGVCVLVKRPELVDGFARQFRGDAGEYRARKEYLAIGVGDVPTGSTVAYEQTGVDTNDPATTHDDVASTPEFTGVHGGRAHRPARVHTRGESDPPAASGARPETSGFASGRRPGCAQTRAHRRPNRLLRAHDDHHRRRRGRGRGGRDDGWTRRRCWRG